MFLLPKQPFLVMPLAWICLPLVKWHIRLRGFQRTCRRMGIDSFHLSNTVTGDPCSPHLKRAFHIQGAVKEAGRYWPGKHRNCLERALLTCLLIQHLDIPCRVQIGIQSPSTDQKEIAHAWVEINGVPVGESLETISRLKSLHRQHPTL
jgi:hypothetical protein